MPDIIYNRFKTILGTQDAKLKASQCQLNIHNVKSVLVGVLDRGANINRIRFTNDSFYMFSNIMCMYVAENGKLSSHNENLSVSEVIDIMCTDITSIKLNTRRINDIEKLFFKCVPYIHNSEATLILDNYTYNSISYTSLGLRIKEHCILTMKNDPNYELLSLCTNIDNTIYHEHAMQEHSLIDSF